ncbi:hypothetical protein Ahy_A06g026381 isoform B [Arachis hypogaea]|nr:hypothetical protein Ahy_A06g026381 isoform B [Arachis hypogaea]
MEFSTPVGGSNNTLTSSIQGDEELSAGEVVIQKQEGFKGDEITDVIVMSKDELELSKSHPDRSDDRFSVNPVESADLLPNHSGISEEEISVIGMNFDSFHLAQKFYANYAKKVGFVTKFRNTNFDKTRKESKIPVNQFHHCTREGYQESRVKAATRENRITATICRTRMYVMLDREKECWVVSRLKLRHSYPYSAKKDVHYHEYRELTMHAKCIITDNDETGIRPNKTYLVLANEVDFKGMMNYFVRMKEINSNFFYAIDVDDANKFRSALWVDARCRASYECYRDVVSFDTTYRRNKSIYLLLFVNFFLPYICFWCFLGHGIPFASFVGVNHHEKSTLLGCALLGSEEIPSFEWVFTQWVRCVGTTPREIITDQCKAMVGAIRKVLPDTVHR